MTAAIDKLLGTGAYKAGTPENAQREANLKARAENAAVAAKKAAAKAEPVKEEPVKEEPKAAVKKEKKSAPSGN